MTTTRLHNLTPVLQGLPQTPYRALLVHDQYDAGTQLIPNWAEKRNVYRAGHSTYYVVETSQLADARSDLHRLEQLGWTVSVHPLGFDGSARITMSLSATETAA